MNGTPRKGQFPLYLITGLILGLVMGLTYAWQLSPVKVIDTIPASMSEHHQDAYRLLVANAYMTNGDIRRAVARLDLLEEKNMVSTIEDQSQRLLSLGENMNDTRAMATLLDGVEAYEEELSVINFPVTEVTEESEYSVFVEASPTPLSTNENESIGQATQTVSEEPVATMVQEEPAQTPTLVPTPTSIPTQTPTATPVPAYSLQSFEMVCDVTIGMPLIQVVVQKASGEQVPGVPIMVIWDEGDNVFYTGLKPSFGLGYADYEMTPGVSYDLHMVEGGEGVVNLTPLACERADGSTYWSGWLVNFRQE